MVKSWILYEHISPSGKVYVGITSQKKVYKRWRYGNGYNYCTLFNNAIKKYGWNNFKHIIVASNLGEKTAKNMEKDLVKYYKNKEISYNITDGGDGTLGRKFSIEAKIKMSKSHKGKIITKEWRNNMRIGQLRRDKSTQYIPTVEDRIRHSIKMKEYYKTHSNPRKGITLEETTKLKCLVNQKSRKPIVQYDLNMNVICEYLSISQASRITGFTLSKISECCKGKLNKYKNFYWKYKDDYKL